MVVKLPIVYVRGYAGSAAGVDTATDDAFYGFNAGSTHVRVDGDGNPVFFQFESELLRLMIDEDYKLLVRGDQSRYLLLADPGSLISRTVWVYRFYDAAAGTFGGRRERFDIIEAARGLYDFVTLIRSRTVDHPKVYLVAHSMGGLVCRTMMQRVCQEDDEWGNPRLPAGDLVDKLLTIGTPHYGIATRFAAIDLLNEVVGIFGSEIFARRNMYGYLTPGHQMGDNPPADWRANEIVGFDPDRVFCVVGTDPTDYGAARLAVGAKSDGLVRVDNAYVRGAPRSFVHRSHSGRYGLVNSEESYQNLRRFLFGSHRVEVYLAGLDLVGEEKEDLSALSDDELLAEVAGDDADDREFDTPAGRFYWQADVQVTVRGLQVVMHDQSVEHNCPVQVTEEQVRRRRETELRRRRLLADGGEAGDTADTPVPLTTVFLLDPSRFVAERPTEPIPPRCRYTLRLRLFRIRQRGRFLSFQQNLEQVADWEDTLIVDVGRSGGPDDQRLHAWAAWNSAVPGPNADRDPISDKPLDIKGGLATVQFPETARAGILGTTASIEMRITNWV